MPELRDLEVEASKLREGDVVISSHTGNLTVERTEVKTLYTYVYGEFANGSRTRTGTTGSRLRIMNTDAVMIQRQEQTEQEKHDEELTHSGRGLASKFNGAMASVMKFAQELECYPGNGPQILKWADGTMEAAAVIEFIGRDLWNMVAYYGVEAGFANWKTKLEERLLNDEWRGGSTSAASNAQDAAYRAAASSFVRGYIW